MRSVREIVADIDAVMRPAEARLAAAEESSRALYPCASDWATAEELAQLNAFQLELVAHPETSTAAARARVAAKRAARLSVDKR